jgi:hypothetical protein
MYSANIKIIGIEKAFASNVLIKYIRHLSICTVPARLTVPGTCRARLKVLA